VAPIWEELLFRGLLIAGLQPTRLGASGAVLVSAAVWALIHGQYDFYGIATIFACGLLFGAARLRTGSILVPIAMHVVQNALALLETAILLK
jgi:membrane protease YdiL (CAAX protease family)